MSSILERERDIRKYQTLKTNTIAICEKLSLAINNTDNLNKEIISKYSINGNRTPITSRTEKLKSDIKETYNYLKNNVLPAIDLEIFSLNKENKNQIETERQEKIKLKQQQIKQNQLKAKQKQSVKQNKTEINKIERKGFLLKDR